MINLVKIIPAINCSDFDCVKKKLKKAAEFAKWVQLDIADGIFTEHATWNNPAELKDLIKINLEVHLMVNNPEKVMNEWIKAGVKRIIIHFEAIRGLRSKIYDSKDCEIGLAINPETPVEDIASYLNEFKFVQILAVPPGKSGQKLDERVLEKIKFLKQNYPDVIIEVDGGINLETAKLCKDAGADIIVVGSYIFDDSDPIAAYRRLMAV